MQRTHLLLVSCLFFASTALASTQTLDLIEVSKQVAAAQAASQSTTQSDKDKPSTHPVVKQSGEEHSSLVPAHTHKQAECMQCHQASSAKTLSEEHKK